MAIRSGRFKGNAAGDGIAIVSGRSGLFRIYNTGDSAFTVRPRAAATKDVTVPIDCSVDVNVSGVCSIRAAGAVEGIYEYLSLSRRVRSGRFKGTAASAATIVQDANKEFYRLLNSGDNDIAVQPSGTTLKPTFSIDVSVQNNITVAGTNIECIYERLYEDQDTRSGRFKIELPLPTPNPYPHKVIDLQGGGDTAWYRLYNSGKTPIIIQEGNAGGAGTLVGVVAPKDSFDFEVNAIDLYVRPDDNDDGLIDPAGDNTKPIEGSFDFLGPS